MVRLSLSFPSPSSNNITKSRPAFYSRDSPLNSFLLRSRVLICLCVCVLDSNRRVRIRSTSAASSASVPTVPLSLCVCLCSCVLAFHPFSLSRERTESSQRCCDGRRLTGGLLLTDKRKKHLDHRERETPTLPSFFFSYVTLTGRKCIQPILLLRLCVRCVSDTKAKNYIRIKSFVFVRNLPLNKNSVGRVARARELSLDVCFVESWATGGHVAR